MLPIVFFYAQHSQVGLIRIAATWTLSKIIQESILILDLESTLRDMIPLILVCLRDENKKVLHHACLCIINLTETLQNIEPETGPLSAYTEKLLDTLLQVGDEKMQQPQNWSHTIYEAISSLIQHSKLVHACL